VQLNGDAFKFGQQARGDTWAELLSVSSPDTETLLTYGPDNGWLAGKPAMISRALGAGTIAYLGTLLDSHSMEKLLAGLSVGAGAPPIYYPLPAHVEVCVRGDSSNKVTIVINHGNTPAEVDLYGRMRSLLPQIAAIPTILGTNVPSTHVALPPQGVAVLVPAEHP
jgi:beta-galactosidase